MATVAVSFLIAPVIFFAFRDVDDSYGIRVELLWTYAITNAVLVVYIVYEYWENDRFVFPGELVLAFGFMSLHFVSMLYPLLHNASGRARSFSRAPDVEKGRVKEKGNRKLFDKMLQDPLLFEEFRKFTVKDFSVENALFYEFSSRLVHNPPPPESPVLRENQMEIYNLFVSEKADFPLNLSARTISAIRGKVRAESFEIALYDDARREVADMMYTDTWGRFWKTKTPQWKADLIRRVDGNSSTPAKK